MSKNAYYVGIAFFAMVNGIYNPVITLAFFWTKVLMNEPLFGIDSLLFMVASLILSTSTIILAGIPAALYERFAGVKGDSSDVSLWIWLSGTALLTLPAVGNFLDFGL